MVVYSTESPLDSDHQANIAESDCCSKPSSYSPNEIGHADIIRTPRKPTDTLARAASSPNPIRPPFPTINPVVAAADEVISGIFLPPIIGDSKSINPQSWHLLSASERVAFLQRWLMYAEIKYKAPIDRWPEEFAQEWSMLKRSSSASQCLIAAKQKLFAGTSLLNYVARVMEGDLPDNAEQWRAIYVQTYHITGIVTRACANLQCKIDAAVAEITTD